MLVQHIFAAERVKAFSDAVFAIIATIMVIPLKLDREEVMEGGGFEGFDLDHFLVSQYPKYLIYIFSFIVVLDAWYSHVRIFSIVEQVDDVILWLNLMLLLFISFLPYGIGLVSEFQASRPEGFHLAITIAALPIILIGLTMIIILAYAFRKQALLHPEIAQCEDIRIIKTGLYTSLLVNSILAVIAIPLSYLRNLPEISLLFFYAIGSASVVVRIGFFLYYKRKHFSEHTTALFRTVASKMRTEAFSDGIFSIVATLIVLDLTTGNVPSVDDVRDKYGGHLGRALHDQRLVFFAYVASFLIVGLLWFVQHGMFQFITKMTPTLSFLNTATLALICGIPFVAGVNVIFSDPENETNNPNEIISIRAVSILTFLVGISQLIFWTVAHLTKDQCLSEEVDKYPAEVLQFSKIIVIPTISFINFWATFSNQVTAHNIYAFLLFTTPFLFLILKAVFKWHGKCKNAVSKQLSNVHMKIAGEESLLLQEEEREGPAVYGAYEQTQQTLPVESSEPA